MRFSLNPQFDLKDLPGASRFKVLFTIQLLLRKARSDGPGITPARFDKKGGNDMNVTTLIIQLLCGAVGGNVAGSLMKKSSLGTVGNSIAGILGGGIGGQILGMLTGGAAAAAGGLDAGSIISSVLGGASGEAC